jgi:hypothetical protein
MIFLTSTFDFQQESLKIHRKPPLCPKSLAALAPSRSSQEMASEDFGPAWLTKAFHTVPQSDGGDIFVCS